MSAASLGRGAPARFGIEEEHLLLTPATLDIARHIPSGFVGDCTAALGDCFATEMFQCQVELVSPILQRLDEAADFLGGARHCLAEVAGAHGLGTLCVAAHPFADSLQARPMTVQRYRHLFIDHGLVAKQSLLCGLHVHVEVIGQDRIQLMNRVLPWLPLLLLLSASSPFWNGVSSRLQSYRRALCGQWPRMNIPPNFDDEADWQRYVEFLLQRRMMREPSHTWWFIRPSVRYPTLELRICDACPRVSDAVCVAGLFRALLVQAMHDGKTTPPHWQQALVAENLWQAQRHGCRGRFLVEEGDCLTAREWLERAWAHCGARAREGNEWAYRHACQIVEEGNAAERQLRLYRRHCAAGEQNVEALRQVTEALIMENREQGLPDWSRGERSCR